MNEKLGYVLETIRFKTSIYRDKKKRNLSFNDDDYYSNILNEYITDLQQENERLKEERKQIKEYVEKCNFDNAEILFDFGSEYCYIDDFKEHILEILKEN